MSLADRLRRVQPARGNHGCMSCQWWAELGDETRSLIEEWIGAGHSLRQLYFLLSTPDPDDPDYVPLPVSESGWRAHLRHRERRDGQAP